MIKGMRFGFFLVVFLGAAGPLTAQTPVLTEGSYALPPESYLLGSYSTIRATVIKIDPETRVITLKTDQDKVQELVAGPEVLNFAQIKKGDQVTFKIQESLSFLILKPGTPSDAETKKETVIKRAPAGGKPKGEMSETGSIVTTVVARDLKAGSVTLKYPDNSFRVLTVKDVTKLDGVQPGDRVIIQATRKVAVAVTPPAS